MTRQRRWQLKMNAQCRCVICGQQPLKTRQHCAQHAQLSARIAKAVYQRRRRDPIAERARNALGWAIRSGRIARPVQCSRCGTRDPKINGHHYDYSKPFDVLWLCYSCHALVEGRGQKASSVLQEATP